tara:strand:+ start:445 stop:888 length:444 start_codon:yes stop_codon:yes gene_type:complete
MRKILTLVAILAVAFQFVACNNVAEEQNKEIEAIKAEVMKVHDDAMALMGDLGSEEVRISEKVTALKADTTLASDSLTAVSIASYEVAIANIGSAKAEMMNWMNNYAEPAEDATFEEKKAFYLAEQEKVNAVMNDINANIAASKEVK